MNGVLTSHPFMLAFVTTGLSLWFYLYLKDVRANPRRLPYPPGPKGYPLIGSLLEATFQKPWLKYTEWNDKHGDMVFFKLAGQPFLVIGSPERAAHVFDKRSSVYSDRPKMITLMDFMGWGYNMSLVAYGPWWRRLRRVFHEHFNDNEVPKYQPIQLRKCRVFLKKLLDTPDDFYQHIRHLFAATIMDITYGMEIEDMNEPLIQHTEEVLRAGSEAVVPGNYLVEIIPALRYVPKWFPGAGWKRRAEEINKLNYYVSHEPFETVKRQLKQGVARPSLAATLIEALSDQNGSNRDTEEEVARCATASTYAGGADTTVSTIQSFFLAMCIYPEVQKKAQEELDRVLGDRLPDFDDRDSLPYIDALGKEALRWNPVGPLGLPHMCSENDEYEGYFVPKGTIVSPNIWRITHDPTAYDEPYRFMPDRFLKNGKWNPDARDPSTTVFGYGRRLCPGSHFSNAALFITLASVLSVFDILPPLDEYNQPVKMEPIYNDDFIQYPEPFKARIVPRLRKAELVRNLEFSE